MNVVTAEIDVTKPAGRRLVQDLENKKYVKIVYENPEETGNWCSFSDLFQRGLDKMSEHYGVDMRELMLKKHPKTYYEAIQL